MAVKDFVEKHYIELGNNCAEGILRSANEAWGLDLEENTFRAVGGFGGGCGCGEMCGAIAGGVAAMGFLYIPLGGSSHDSPEMSPKAALLLQRAKQEFGSLRCEVIKEACFAEGRRCLNAVQRAAALLEEVKNTEIEQPTA